MLGPNDLSAVCGRTARRGLKIQGLTPRSVDPEVRARSVTPRSCDPEVLTPRSLRGPSEVPDPEVPDPEVPSPLANALVMPQSATQRRPALMLSMAAWFRR